MAFFYVFVVCFILSSIFASVLSYIFMYEKDISRRLVFLS